MSTVMHTPGPWRIGDAGHTIFGPPKGTPAPEIITALSGGPHRPANARLIVKAPEMLDLLYRLLPYMEDVEADPAYKPRTGQKLSREILALLKEIDPERKQ